jgi:integrase
VASDYVLFDDLKYNDAVRALRQAYEELRREPKSFHCCRHSYATFLVGKTRSYFLARAVLGHRSDAFDRYNHIYEQIALKAKQKVQEIDEIA